MSFVSILIALNRLKDASVYLDQLIDICQQFEMDLVTAKLNLIQGSLVLKLEDDSETSR